MDSKRATQFPTSPNLTRKRGQPESIEEEQRKSRQKLGPIKIGSFPPTRPLKIYKKSPWDTYQQFLKDDQGGSCTLAYRANSPAFTMCAIREHKFSPTASQLNYLFECSHPNIVCLKEAYFHKSLSFVYEGSDVSLAEIQASPSCGLADFELAAIFKELLKALQFIHVRLKIQYGRLCLENILISQDGSVKLGEKSERFKNIANQQSKHWVEHDYTRLRATTRYL
jgi:serine/threonine protein kinase